MCDVMTFNIIKLEVTLQDIQQMSRSELVNYLTTHGVQVTHDDLTEILRQRAIEDWEGKILEQLK